VVCVYPFEDLNEAISKANALPFSFQASVFTKDIETAMHCYKRLDEAAVMINFYWYFGNYRTKHFWNS
jgi:acyl-CoA reductase-like NAD-dependent aldehyde dehydrogenase